MSFTVDTADSEDDTRGSCSDAMEKGREVVYQLTLAAPRTVTITTNASDGGTADPVLYVREASCESGVELGCADSFSAPEVFSQALAAGDYFVFIDSWTSESAGPTVVTVTLGP